MGPIREAAARLGVRELAAVEEAGGLLYVTISNGDRLLACYRVRNDGKLKYLRRVPAALKKE